MNYDLCEIGAQADCRNTRRLGTIDRVAEVGLDGSGNCLQQGSATWYLQEGSASWCRVCRRWMLTFLQGWNLLNEWEVRTEEKRNE